MSKLADAIRAGLVAFRTERNDWRDAAELSQRELTSERQRAEKLHLRLIEMTSAAHACFNERTSERQRREEAEAVARPFQYPQSMGELVKSCKAVCAHFSKY